MVAVNCGGRGRDGVLGVVWLRWCCVVCGCVTVWVLLPIVLRGICVRCGVVWYMVVVFCGYYIGLSCVVYVSGVV